jgi:hypothetical protein
MKTRAALSTLPALLAIAVLGGPKPAHAQVATAPAPAAAPAATTHEELAPRPRQLSRSSPAAIRYQVGAQDMWVPDVDSHTYGINVAASFDATLPSSGTHLVLEGTLFLDFDQDHLDPHHTPLWTQLHLGLDGPIFQSSSPGLWYVSWTGDVNTRANTVSSIEREIKIIPALAVGGKVGVLSLEGRMGGGYFHQAIDDDVPTHRGYTRDDLKNQAWVLSPAVEATLQLTPRFKLLGSAQEWHDGSTWLETRYYASLDWDLNHVIPHAVLEFSVEATQYNLSMYHPANPAAATSYLPILPWDNDRLVTLSLNKWW